MTLIVALAIVSIMKIILSVYTQKNPQKEKDVRVFSIFISILYYSMSAYLIIKYAPLFWEISKTFYSILK